MRKLISLRQLESQNSRLSFANTFVSQLFVRFCSLVPFETDYFKVLIGITNPQSLAALVCFVSF